MCGGGGSVSPADPLQQAQAQILIERERAKLDEELRLKRLEEDAIQAEADKAAFTTNLDAATAGALQRGRSTIEDRNLDFADFENMLLSEINAVKQSVPFLDPSPGAFFADNIGDIVLDRATANERRDLTSALQAFASPGFDDLLFPNTADDAILDAILAEQLEPANLALQRAFARGNLTDTGLNAAKDILGGQETAARSRLQSIGGGVLTDFRRQLEDIANTGFTRANTFELGQNFDPLSVETQINDTVTDLTDRLEGNIRTALGGEELFNVEDLITRGGIAQGAQNTGGPTLGNPGLLDAFAQRELERNKQRGLGSTGVF